MKILVNDKVIDCTPDEESKILEERANATKEQAALAIQEAAAAVAKQNRLDSVKTKLEALGLTTEEVKDAFGL